MARTRIDIPEDLEPGIRKRAESRNISLAEAVRQIMTLGWATWKDRGCASRVQRHRANQRVFQERLHAGQEVSWTYFHEGQEVTHTGVIQGRSPFNPKLWDVLDTTLNDVMHGSVASMPVALIKPKR